MTVESLYRRWSGRLLERTARLTDRRDDAEDACQRAWSALVEDWDRLSFPDEARAFAWLSVVAKHGVYQLYHLRSREDAVRPVCDEYGKRLDATLALEHLIVTRSGRFSDDSSRHELIDIMDVLPRLSESRQVGVMSRLLGLSYKETQQATGGRTHSWVNRAVNEGRHQLRQELAA